MEKAGEKWLINAAWTLFMIKINEDVQPKVKVFLHWKSDLFWFPLYRECENLFTQLSIVKAYISVFINEYVTYIYLESWEIFEINHSNFEENKRYCEITRLWSYEKTHHLVMNIRIFLPYSCILVDILSI